MQAIWHRFRWGHWPEWYDFRPPGSRFVYRYCVKCDIVM